MRFSPGIYEHAAALIHSRPWTVSHDADLLADAHRVAWERYHHPLVVAGIDVYNLEPEAYGALIPEPAGNNIPSIAQHPCSEVEDLLELTPLNPLAHDRITGVLKAAESLAATCENSRVLVPVCGPFALAIGLIGMDELLMSVVEDPGLLSEALGHLLEGQRAYMRAVYERGLEPLIFESGTTPPLLPAEAFRRIEAPLLAELMEFGRGIGGQAPGCIIGGDAAAVAEPLFETGPGLVIAPSETDRAAFMEVARRFPQTHVRVNMSATVLLVNDFGKVRAEADRCLDLARERDNTSVGCGVVPYEADPDLVCRVADHVENQIESQMQRFR